MHKALAEISAVNGVMLGSISVSDINEIASAVGIVTTAIFSIVRAYVVLRDSLRKNRQTSQENEND